MRPSKRETNAALHLFNENYCMVCEKVTKWDQDDHCESCRHEKGATERDPALELDHDELEAVRLEMNGHDL